jgi:hypothetical protein
MNYLPLVALAIATGLIAAPSNSTQPHSPGVSVYVSATPDNPADDDQPAIQSALDTAKNLANLGSNVTVHFNPGVYHLDGGLIQTGYNTGFHLIMTGVNAGSISIDGHGAELVSRDRHNGLFLINLNSAPLTISDLSVDVDPLPYVDGTVSSIIGLNPPPPGSPIRYVTIDVVRGISDPAVFQAEIQSGAFNHWGWVLDPTVPGRPKLGSDSDFKALSVVAPASGKLKFEIPGNQLSTLQIGDRFTYHIRKGNNFRVDYSDQVSFDHVTSYGGGQMFINANHSANMSITNCATAIKPGRWRAGNGDGIHNYKTDSIFINQCTFEGISDDAIHLKSCNTFTISNCTFVNKRRHAIVLDGDAEATSSSILGLISNNSASFNGGAFFVHGGATYLNTVFSGNVIHDNHIASGGGTSVRARIVNKASVNLPLVITTFTSSGGVVTGEIKMGRPRGLHKEWDVMVSGATGDTAIHNFGIQFQPDWFYLTSEWATVPTGTPVLAEQPAPGLLNSGYPGLSWIMREDPSYPGYFFIQEKGSDRYLTLNPVNPLSPAPNDPVKLQAQGGVAPDLQLWRLDAINE